ncbi:hypothetical protein JCM16776_1390 [Leptotrichia shahii]|uniref:Uncharacterized protein n=1 Tax=Leptotrichia shahii TaxID=157691 RepID=A0A510JP73_9FUSO|nr:hypothetical protein [Leptotrichia shahii]BBM41169.1 hypothetical protein JCM16776_1390 [Leptotrichia shahii]
MKKMIIDRRKSIMLVMTCIIFMMTYSSLIGTPSFSHKLSVFVNENNLSHEDIRDLIVKINQFKSRDNRRFAQELEKIGKRKEKEKNNNNLFFLFRGNQDIIYFVNKNYQRDNKISGDSQDIYAFFSKKSENNLRVRE